MEQEKKKELPGISRQEEEAFLERTLAIVRHNVENYGKDVARMKEDIDEMLEHFHDDNPEVINLLENTITMHDHLKRALERNEKALNKPYFGRIDFYDMTFGREECYYIGRGGIAEDSTHQAVVDWRAPVANTYYENGIGKCSYVAPGGERMEIDLKRKRTYEILEGKLLDYYDSEVIANDELLTRYLAKNKEAVLGEIVATIQKEQNDIIRKSPYHNVIVQGVAGSGKTTVAMHRISYILYNYQERFRPDDFYIVGSNRILLNYITGVLPDLDVYGVRQMTMEQLFIRLLYEQWDDKKYGVCSVDRSGVANSIKGTGQWFDRLKAWCDKLEWETIPRQSIYLNPRQFVEGFRDGKTGVFDETQGKEPGTDELVLLMDREAVERYITQNPTVSLQSKIDMLNDRLLIKIQDEFLGKGVKYTTKEKKAIVKAYRGRYGSQRWKKPVFTLYREFLEQQRQQGYGITLPEKEFDVYDLAALAYLYKRIIETEVIVEARHIVIDEAQDFGMMVYKALHFCIGGCTYTVMGDVSQNIHFGYGLNDWEQLRTLLLSGERDSFGVLKKSYRNTVEISEFATNILRHGRFFVYPSEPIIRHGKEVAVQEAPDYRRMMRAAARQCRDWQERGLSTIAVVCRSREQALEAAKELSAYVEVMESDLERAEFGNGIMVLPVDWTKGLEFDAVLILNPTGEDYPKDDGHARLLYVAATRALHELCIWHTGGLTGLITDPIIEENRAAAPVADREAEEITHIGPIDTGKGRSGFATAADASFLRQEEQKSVALPQTPPSRSEKKPSVNVRKKIVIASGQNDRENGGDGPAENAAKKPAIQVRTGRGTFKAEGNLRSLLGKDRASARLAPDSGAAPGTNVASDQNRPPETGTDTVAFGDMPATGKLRLLGHGKIDLAVRWMEKRPEGIYLQSRYGILRLAPVGNGILRVSFRRGGEPEAAAHPKIAADRVEKGFRCKEIGGAIELSTKELCVRVDKASGAISYFDGAQKLLLQERRQECRQLEPDRTGGQIWLHFQWQGGERLYAPGPKGALDLRKTARYISYGEKELPFLLSDKGYGILLATDGPVLCCDLPAYGSYLLLEKTRQLDFYFICGKKPDRIADACDYLLGRM